MKSPALSRVMPFFLLPLAIAQTTPAGSASPSGSVTESPSSKPSSSPTSGGGGGGSSESETGSVDSVGGPSLTYASDIVVPATPPVRSATFG
ncbi:hypothetical protein FQN49_008850, partial [Arthroderma sp. PD_2]